MRVWAVYSLDVRKDDDWRFFHGTCVNHRPWLPRITNSGNVLGSRGEISGVDVNEQICKTEMDRLKVMGIFETTPDAMKRLPQSKH